MSEHTLNMAYSPVLLSTWEGGGEVVWCDGGMFNTL